MTLCDDLMTRMWSGCENVLVSKHLATLRSPEFHSNKNSVEAVGSARGSRELEFHIIFRH